jgi:hypothetical protein
MSLAARPVVTGGAALMVSGLVAITPTAAPPDLPRVSSEPVRLTSSETDALDALASGLTGGTPVTSLSAIEADLSTINDSLGLNTLATDLDSLFNPNGFGTDLTDLFNSLLGGASGIQNVPYNLFADLINIPYYESAALQEYAFALSPGGSVGGVAGWIPPGATVDNGGVDVINGQDYYALGGTGSWYMESLGNTWGWDDGNWAQVDGLVHFLLPFQFTEGITEQAQGILQAESIDGADVNCEFQCASITDYFGQWFHVPLSQLEAGYTYPTVLEDSVGATSATGVINAGGSAGQDVIWSGQTFTADPTLGLDSIWQNLTAAPSADPIMFTNFDTLLTDAELLAYNVSYDFNPTVEGSFIWWGAPNLYSVPDLLGGELHDLTGLPNFFALPNDGAEPLSGYTTTAADLLPGLEQGFQNFATDLAKYFDPAAYSAGAVDTAALGSLGDSGALAAELSAMLSNAGTDLSTLLGPQLGTDFSTLLTDLATSLIP